MIALSQLLILCPLWLKFATGLVFILRLFFRKRRDPQQTQRQVGSQNLQAGRDINISLAPSQQEPKQSAPSEDGKLPQDLPPAEASPRPADPVQLAADRRSFEALQAIINSDWMVSWEEWQTTNSQYLKKDVVEKFTAYEYESRKPERKFFSEILRTAHEAFLTSVQRFMSRTALIMVPYQGGESVFVIRTKAEGEKHWIEDYDERYEREADEVEQLTDSAWIAWQDFMRVAAVTFIS